MGTWRNSGLRPASSVYSQPSPQNSEFPGTLASRQAYHHLDDAEDTDISISPPSSPEPDYTVHRDRRQMHRAPISDISPIEEDDPFSFRPSRPVPVPPSRDSRTQEGQGSQSRTSNVKTIVPMMLRSKRQENLELRITSRENGAAGEMRWDPMMGQRTKGSPVRRPSLSLGDRMRKMAQVAKDEMGFGHKINHRTDAMSAAVSPSRPAWKGASGRTAIVDPVRDTKQTAMLSMPEQRIDRGATQMSPNLYLAVSRDQTPSSSRQSPLGSETRRVSGSVRRKPSPLPTTGAMHNDLYYSSPSPTNDSFNGPALAAKQLANAIETLTWKSPDNSPIPQNSTARQPTIKRKPTQKDVRVPSVYSQQDDTVRPASLATDEPWVQPPSRFSTSTRATEGSGSPRESLETKRPPMPTVPQQYQDSARPLRVADEDMSSFFSSQASRDRRAVPAHGLPAHPAVNRARTTTERPGSNASSTNKLLPLAPPELSADQANDRVALLNAQLSSLANRRVNLFRSIQQMTELMPTDNLMASQDVLRRREMEKLKVATLREELAEVQRLEHELGIKLHRANKRRDRDLQWEPTTLWIRRVTG